MSTPPPILNLDDIELRSFGKGGTFSAMLGRIGAPLGMQKIGCGLVVLEPGNKAWPIHEHYAQEELFIILEGQGSIRYADGTYPVRTGDVIFTPPGKNTAHQIINTSDAPLRYLAFSSTDSPEICFYPDSGKYGTFHHEKGGSSVYFMAHEDARTDYWDGED
jgi:uncharacterized cupin superfamily protein